MSARNRKEGYLLPFLLLVLFLPTQLGKHFWPPFSFLLGFRIDYLSPTLYFTDILALLFGIAALWDGTNRQLILGFLYRHRRVLVLVLLSLFLSSVFSRSPLLGLYGDLKVIEFLLVGLLIARVVKRKRLTPVVSTLMVSAGGESLLAIGQYLHQGSIGGALYLLGERQFTGQTPGIANAVIDGHLVLRPYGTLPHPNVLAGFLLVVLILSVWYLRSASARLSKTLSFLFLLIGSAALFLTLSRTAIMLYLLFWIGLGVAVLLDRKRYLVKQLTAGIGMLLLGTILVSRTLPDVWIRIGGTRMGEIAVLSRVLLLREGAVIFLAHPLFGVGVGETLPALSRLSPLLYPWQVQPIHMIYLVLLTETGLWGGALFAWFMAKTLQHTRQLDWRKSANAYLATAFVCLLLIGLVDHYLVTLQQGQLLFALIWGMLWQPQKG